MQKRGLLYPILPLAKTRIKDAIYSYIITLIVKISIAATKAKLLKIYSRQYVYLVGATGIEPVTFSLSRKYSTAEICSQNEAAL